MHEKHEMTRDPGVGTLGVHPDILKQRAMETLKTAPTYEHRYQIVRKQLEQAEALFKAVAKKLATPDSPHVDALRLAEAGAIVACDFGEIDAVGDFLKRLSSLSRVLDS